MSWSATTGPALSRYIAVSLLWRLQACTQSTTAAWAGWEASALRVLDYELAMLKGQITVPTTQQSLPYSGWTSAGCSTGYEISDDRLLISTVKHERLRSLQQAADGPPVQSGSSRELLE